MRNCSWAGRVFGSVLIAAAHPDDEAIGLGVRLAEMHDVTAILHVTDGAPRSGADIERAGCRRWEQYAILRRREFEKALGASGVRPKHLLCLGIPDQQASFRIRELATELAEIFAWLHPDTVFTHAYEGGHPDHDATAAGVHAAGHLLGGTFTVYEFSSYHARGTRMECECFLGADGTTVVERRLTVDERRRKRKIFACHASQRHVLKNFPLGAEPIRRAPEYDFTQPPHPGMLYYEQFQWGVTGAQWRKLAGAAFQELGIPTGMSSAAR